jgi:hypothetical protein
MALVDAKEANFARLKPENPSRMVYDSDTVDATGFVERWGNRPPGPAMRREDGSFAPARRSTPDGLYIG